MRHFKKRPEDLAEISRELFRITGSTLTPLDDELISQLMRNTPEMEAEKSGMPVIDVLDIREGLKKIPLSQALEAIRVKRLHLDYESVEIAALRLDLDPDLVEDVAWSGGFGASPLFGRIRIPKWHGYKFEPQSDGPMFYPLYH